MSLQSRRKDILLCFFNCPFHLQTSFSLSIQLVFSLSSQQQELDLKTLNDRLRQQCFNDRKNNTNDPSKCISKVIFANVIDSFTKTSRKAFWMLKSDHLLMFYCPCCCLRVFPRLPRVSWFPALTARLPNHCPRLSPVTGCFSSLTAACMFHTSCIISRARLRAYCSLRDLLRPSPAYTVFIIGF